MPKSKCHVFRGKRRRSNETRGRKKARTVELEEPAGPKNRYKRISERSGAPARIPWEYFEDEDEIFHQDHDITPVATSASMPSPSSFPGRTRSRSPPLSSSPSPTVVEQASAAAQRYEEFIGSQRTVFSDFTELQRESCRANKEESVDELKRRTDLQEKALDIEIQRLEQLKKQAEAEQVKAEAAQVKAEAARKLIDMLEKNKIVEKVSIIFDKLIDKLG